MVEGTSWVSSVGTRGKEWKEGRESTQVAGERATIRHPISRRFEVAGLATRMMLGSGGGENALSRGSKVQARLLLICHWLMTWQLE